MAIRDIDTSLITRTVKQLCLEATTVLNPDVIAAFEKGLAQEVSPQGKEIFRQLADNARIAREESISLCQDAGMAVVFIEIGQDVHLSGAGLTEAVNEGVRQGYAEGYLRPSTLDPISRENYGDNTPAILHLDMVPGDRVGIHVLPKGFGGENMSRVMLFHPGAGLKGARDFVVNRVREAGANSCPPNIVGVGIGGNFEKCALIAKRALLRPVGQSHPDPAVARLEQELLRDVNRTGVGPQGLGGRVTALAVHIETYPTHIGSLPVAVNLQCHSHRCKSAVL
jgi:fumarate hydratase subunit alpha